MYRKSYQTRSSNTKEKGNYFHWSSDMDQCLVKILADQVKKGNKTDNALKPAAYVAALTVVNKKFGLNLTKEHLRNRLRTLKKQFGILKALLAQEGFQWDEKRRMVVADASLWKDYIKAHPDARQFQERYIDNYDELCIIIDNDQAIAGCSENDAETHMQSAASRDVLDTASSSDIQSDDNHVKNLRWTDAMDYYLGKSLAEKVKDGSKMDSTLQREAFDAAISTLNEKIGLELTRDHIRNRLKTWKKQYGILKQMFSHPGFKWDKAQKMITADDSVWTNHIKDNPDARTFRGRVLGNYDNLCTIFGNENDVAEAVDISPVQTGGKVKDQVRNDDNLCTIFGNENDVAEAVDISLVQTGGKVKDQAKNMMWTYEMDSCLSMVLAEQVKLGNKSKIDNKLRPSAYLAALSALNKRFQRDLTREHIQNRLKTWKKQYEILKGLVFHSEFKWDKTRKMVIANDSAWNQYIKKNPDARCVRGRVIENYSELFAIFGCDDLPESSLNSTNDVDLTANNGAEDTELCFEQGDVAKDKGKYILWTDEMDRCLTEQLVQQVTVGNKLNKSFKPVAFKAALSVINKKFSLELTTENIRNRLRTWKKQFRLVKELLSQQGFDWDERQTMVIGNDSEWRQCIMRNPDMKRIRGRPIHNFNELHIIVGDEQASRHFFEAGDKVENPIQCNEELVEAPVQVVVDEEMGHNNTDDDIQVSSQQTRARPSSSSQSKEPLKRRRTSDIMLELMNDMAANIGRIADALTESKAVSLDELFQMVQTIPDFDDDLIVDACEYLSFDEKRARMFMKLDERLRKRWLLKRLRG